MSRFLGRMSETPRYKICSAYLKSNLRWHLSEFRSQAAECPEKLLSVRVYFMDYFQGDMGDDTRDIFEPSVRFLTGICKSHV